MSNVPKIISAPQTVTGSWADMGDEIDVSQYRRTGIWLDVDINDSQNVRIRPLVKLANRAALEFVPVIKTNSASVIAIEGGYYELNSDADQQIYLEVETNGLIPVLQWQVEAGTAGVSPGIIKSAIATYSISPSN